MRNQYHSDYFQGKLQLRPADQEIMEYVERQVRKDKKVWIAKKVETKNGVDYYMSSNKFLRQLGKRLKKAFKGELKESRKLFSRNRQTSKDVYRVTVCFRLMDR